MIALREAIMAHIGIIPRFESIALSNITYEGTLVRDLSDTLFIIVYSV